MRGWLRRNQRSFDPTVVTLATAAALLSALGGARVVVPQLDAWRERYGDQSQQVREEAIAHRLGFDVGAWERLRRAVRKGDRYVVVATALEQHEVRNYAAYVLLPAIQVTDIEDATVVVYYATDPPPGSPCMPLGGKMCIQRRAEP